MISLEATPRSILALVFATALIGCAQPAGDPDVATVRALVSSSPASLSLIGKTDITSEILSVQITDSLVQYDPGMNLVPRLAESWEFSDDNKQITFHLRKGVRWHDGEPLTAADVVYTVGMVREPGLENRSYQPVFRHLTSLEAIDDRTLLATYSEASPDVLDAWRVPIVPRHIASRDGAPGEHPEGLIHGEYAKSPIGCGPFKFVRYDVDHEIVLEANDDYWDGRPRLDRLVLEITPDQRTAYLSLLNGDLDVMHMTSDLWKEAQDSGEATRLESMVYHRLNSWTIFWNQDGSNPFFTDPRVRRALLLALDRVQFNRSMQHGLAQSGTSPYHPQSPWKDKSIGPTPFDPDAAERLLTEAGWVDSDGDGVRDRNGRAFEFTLLYPVSSQRLADNVAAWQQQSWADIGVKARLQRLEWLSLRERRNAHQFDAVAFSVWYSPIPDMYELYHSEAVDGGFNFGSFADEDVDRLIELGRQEFDAQARVEIYARLQQRIADLEPLTVLFHFPKAVLHDRRIGGIVPSPLDFWTTTEGPRNWYWIEGEGASE